jgi:hypothetical protein
MNGHSIIKEIVVIARILGEDQKKYFQICLVTDRQEKEREDTYGERNSYG